MKDVCICSPEIYYDDLMQEFIHKRCKDEDKQWIYRMIEHMPLQNDNEVVYIREDEWLLCKDIHQGTDFRMLVLFCDRDLKTLRDLRAEHVPLLTSMERKVRAWMHANMKEKQAAKYQIYFHYMPSVYQLHAHVCMPGSFYNSLRSHKLAHVIRNLTTDSLWYHKALIMFSVNKTIRQLQIYNILHADSFTVASNSYDPAAKGGSRTSVRARNQPQEPDTEDPTASMSYAEVAHKQCA